MKITLGLFCCALLLASCGGSISDKQRKEMLEARESQTIQKISEAEIMEMAIVKGRDVMKRMPEPIDFGKVDSIARVQCVEIHFLSANPVDGKPNSVNALAIEQQLIDAYINSVIEGTPLQDNIQKIGSDSLLYTKAFVVTRPDSSIEVKGTWNIRLSKKQLILSRNKK